MKTTELHRHMHDVRQERRREPVAGQVLEDTAALCHAVAVFGLTGLAALVIVLPLVLLWVAP